VCYLVNTHIRDAERPLSILKKPSAPRNQQLTLKNFDGPFKFPFFACIEEQCRQAAIALFQGLGTTLHVATFRPELQGDFQRMIFELSSLAPTTQLFEVRQYLRTCFKAQIFSEQISLRWCVNMTAPWSFNWRCSPSLSSTRRANSSSPSPSQSP
jgi:hypothetical protein